MSLALTGAGPSGGGAAFTPADLPNLAGWWDFSQLALADGAAISSVTDLSPTGIDFSQGTVGKRPTFKTGILNGLGVARFDGTDDALGAVIAASASQTLFIVAVQAAAVSGRYVLSIGAGQAAIGAFTGPYQWGLLQTQVGGVPFLGGNPGVVSVICLRYNSTGSADGFVDSGAAVNYDPNDNYATSTALTLGERGNVSGFWNGDIGEVVRTADAMSEGDRIATRDYLLDKWT